MIDPEGVLYQGGSAIPGACEAIDFLKKYGVPFRCISNAPRKCREEILQTSPIIPDTVINSIADIQDIL